MPPYFCLTLTVASKTLRGDDLANSWATTCATIYSRLKKVGDVANTYVLSVMWNVSNLQGKISKDWSSKGLFKFSFDDSDGKGKIVSLHSQSVSFHLVKGKAKHLPIEFLVT
ncbi:hypothetical protein ACFE04_021504 [Oxalis oulophora]